jgi:EAL domain-containing protein (putative c-di-GMP-specific phosphodiesterase class I)
MEPDVSRVGMQGLETIFEWGRRASDRATSTPAAPVQDIMLESVIAQEQIEVLYQPLIEPGTGRIIGAEALARSPIVPSAEVLFARATAARLDERLSRLVQRKALKCAAVWEGPLKKLKISLNLLPQDLARENYDQWLLDEIESAGIDPKRVTIEITESALIVDQAKVAERLTRLREAGLTIAVDDFGTGYASLAYLISLPLDMLKIDRGLITHIVGKSRDRIVVKAMIQLARELGLQVVVEGVESTGQLVLLAEWGCDLYQGFLGAGALTHEELTRFVAAAQPEVAAA